jgi:hypothetical protein
MCRKPITAENANKHKRERIKAERVTAIQKNGKGVFKERMILEGVGARDAHL